MTAHAPIGPVPAGTGPAIHAVASLLEPGLVEQTLDRRDRLIGAVRMLDKGDVEGALDRIGRLLESHPDWVEGHGAMAQILSQTGSVEAFEQFLVQTLRRNPEDMAMATACLRQLSEAGLHATVEALIPELRARTGEHLFFTLLEAITASECDDPARADRLFARAAQEGGVLSLPHVRHLIRCGDALRAATIAEAFVRDQPRHQGGWGLLATAWRLIGDSRHDWMVGQAMQVRLLDVGVSPDALAALATRLRALHVARFHPFDQSLRGGTQTAGRIFARDEPEIHDVRRALMATVRRYLDELPPAEPGHPLLGQDRSRFAFTDSWSVRLLDGGYHVSHFHPQGTLSSAFYVSLPKPAADQPRAGWLTIGEPPAQLRTGLPPLQTIEPVVGHLALFPSFMWHGTRPFPQGERMTIAFDTLLDG